MGFITYIMFIDGWSPHNWVGFQNHPPFFPPFFVTPEVSTNPVRRGSFSNTSGTSWSNWRRRGPVLFGVNPDVMKILEKDWFLMMLENLKTYQTRKKNSLFLYWMWVHWSPRVDVESFCSFNWVSYDSYAQLVNRISSKTTGLYEARHHSRGFNGWLKG